MELGANSFIPIFQNFHLEIYINLGLEFILGGLKP